MNEQKLTVTKASLLNLLVKINDGALALPQHGIVAMIRRGDPSAEFRQYVDGLMTAVSTLIESNDPNITEPTQRTLPKTVFPYKIKSVKHLQKH